MKKLNGRNWLLFAHDILKERAYIVGQLDSLGYQKIDTFSTVGSSTFLFNFGN
jgi:hypothetical protein